MLMRILSVLTILAVASTSWAADSCEMMTQSYLEQLNNCDRAYNAQRVLISDQKEQIDNYYKKTLLDHQLINDQQTKLDSPFRDPVKMIGLGIVGTVVVEVLLGVFKK